MLEGDTETGHGRTEVSDMEDEAPPYRSLADDLEALYEDGKTYAEAEIAFQKSRARYVGGHAKAGTVYILLALFLAHMLLIGLTVGAILTLSPMVGPLAATAIVVGTLLVLAVVLALSAKARFGKIGAAFGGDEQ